jgi:hypothetical protein
MQPVCPAIEGAMDCRFHRSEAKVGVRRKATCGKHRAKTDHCARADNSTLFRQPQNRVIRREL